MVLSIMALCKVNYIVGILLIVRATSGLTTSLSDEQSSTLFVEQSITPSVPQQSNPSAGSDSISISPTLSEQSTITQDGSQSTSDQISASATADTASFASSSEQSSMSETDVDNITPSATVQDSISADTSEQSSASTTADTATFASSSEQSSMSETDVGNMTPSATVQDSISADTSEQSSISASQTVQTSESMTVSAAEESSLSASTPEVSSMPEQSIASSSVPGQTSMPGSPEESSTAIEPSSTLPISTVTEGEQSSILPSASEESSKSDAGTEESSISPSATKQSSTTEPATVESSISPSSTESSTPESTSLPSSTASIVTESSAPPTTAPITTPMPAATTTLPQSTVTSKPNLGAGVFKLSFEISVNVEFKEGLETKGSDLYIKYERECRETLMIKYSIIPDFMNVTITGFTNGSILIGHSVSFRGDVKEETLNRTLRTVATNILQEKFFNGTVERSIDDQIAGAMVYVSDKCNAEGICHSDVAFRCVDGKTEPNCVSRCASDHCVYGDCKVNSDYEFYCSCTFDDKYLHSGPKCEIRSEKFALSQAAIIGIAVGVGGGIILLLVIVLGVMCYRRSKGKKLDDRDSVDTFKLEKLSRIRQDKVRLSEMKRDEGRPFYNGDGGRSNPGFDSREEGPRYHRSIDHGGEQQTFFRPAPDPRYRGDQRYKSERNEMDYSPRRSPSFNRNEDFGGLKNGDYGSGYHSEEDTGDWEDLQPLNRQRKDGVGRSFYDPADDNDFDSRRSSQVTRSRDIESSRKYSGLSSEEPMKSPPRLLTGRVKEGESVYEHIDTDQAYAIKRPTFR